VIPWNRRAPEVANASISAAEKTPAITRRTLASGPGLRGWKGQLNSMTQSKRLVGVIIPSLER
jgi:hypothetical protein